MENLVASNPGAKFYILGLASLIFLIIYAILWNIFSMVGEDEGHDFTTSLYYVFQIFASGGYDDNIDTAKKLF